MSKSTKHLSILSLLCAFLSFVYGQTSTTKIVNEGQVVEETWLNQTGSELADIQLASLLSAAESTQVLTQLAGDTTTTPHSYKEKIVVERQDC